MRPQFLISFDDSLDELYKFGRDKARVCVCVLNATFENWTKIHFGSTRCVPMLQSLLIIGYVRCGTCLTDEHQMLEKRALTAMM